MTKDEIKSLVAAKIAGQGSMVDVGGGLPTILNEIIDLIPEGGGGGFEPLVVESTDIVPLGTTEFTISADDFNAAKERTQQGLPTYLHVIIHDRKDEANHDFWELITSYNDFDDQLKTDSFTISEE